MTILLVAQVFPPRHGGSGRWLWELYRRLQHATVHVAAGATPGDDAFDRSTSLPISRLSLDFSTWGIMGRGIPQYGRALVRLHRVARQSKPTAIHAAKALPEGLLGWLLSKWIGVPMACYVHGEELTLAGTSRELRLLTQVVLRSANLLVANSQHSRDILEREWKVNPTRISVMHPGVDTTRFVPAPLDQARRASLGWSDRRVILTVGALQKRKGQDMLIRALPAIRAACADVLYAIAGEGWERAGLEQLAADCGVCDIVQFCGAPSDDTLVTYYQQCDLFVLPNRRVGWDLEGFGIVALEAQACGKAVVVGDSGGAPETIQPGVTGEIVNAETPDRLAQVVIALLDDPPRRAAMGQRGRDWSVTRFDWDVLGRQASRLFG